MSLTRRLFVTGATGALGAEVMQRAIEQGWQVNALVRRRPSTDVDGVDYVVGDLTDAASVQQAAKGCQAAVHSAAAMSGDWSVHDRVTVGGTQSVLRACQDNRVGRLIHISSMAVVDWVAGQRAGVISEDTPTVSQPETRAPYVRAKLQAESLVQRAIANADVSGIILRPGRIVGGRWQLLSPPVARQIAGNLVVSGNGDSTLGLVYQPDVVDAVFLALQLDACDGQVVNLVDPDDLTKNEIIALAAPGNRAVHVPSSLLSGAKRLATRLSKTAGRPVPARVRGMDSGQRWRFESKNAGPVLGWQPRIGVRQGIRDLVARGAV